jgi:hypothetical protein
VDVNVLYTTVHFILKMSTFVAKQFLSDRSFVPMSNQPPGFW